MMNKQTWTSPALTNYGSAAKITQQNFNFTKNIGSGDSIVLIVGSASSNITSANGGSLINITNNGRPVGR